MKTGRWAVCVTMLMAACGGGGGNGGGGGGSTGTGSTTEVVVNPGSPPTANAGAAQTYNGGEIAMLDGTGSTDPNVDPLRYTWTQTGGANTVQLYDRHAARPVFEVPNATDVLTFSLVVNDGYDNSPPSNVTINTVAYSGASVPPLSQSPFRGNYSFSGAGQDLVISGTHAYLPAGVFGLRVVDISDPVNLIQAGTMTSPDAQDVTKIGNFIYHTAYDPTFKSASVFATNVSNPAAPTIAGLVALFDSPSSARLTSVSNVLYVGGGNTTTVPSLRVYLVGDITSPLATTTFKVSQLLPAPAEDVEVAGNYAYVAAGASGLRVIDISQATALTPAISETGFYDTAGTALGVAVSGSNAFIADGTNGLVILNVANPAAPSLVSTIPAPSGTFSGVTSVDVSGSTLYFSTDFDVWIYDVSAPASPVLLGRYRATNLIRKVRVSGSYAYVTDSQGLRAIPVSKVSLPRGAPLYTATAAVKEMKVHGDLGFIRMNNRVDILDMRNAAAPTPLSSYTAANFETIYGMAIVDNFAYLSQGSNNLQLLRFRNPAAAAVAKTIAAGTNPQTIVANDAYAYVYRNAFPNADVAIFDVANPFSPVARGTLASPLNNANWLRNMAVKDSRLYLTELSTGGTFRVADVSNPIAPALIGNGLGPVDLYGIAFRNDYVFSIGNNTGVKVLDVSTPGSPAYVGTGYAQPGYSVSVAGGCAYVNSDFVGGGVKVLDAANPLAPTLAGELAPAGGADLPVVAGRSLYTFFNGMELHRNEREPMLASRNVSATAGTILNYSVSWLDEAGGDDHAVKCFVTGGSCAVGVINQAANSVAVSWTLPGAAGDHEIMIAVGNGHYFGTTKDRVKVQ